MRNNISFNSDNDKLHINNIRKQKNYHLVSTLNVPLLRIQCRYCYMILLNYLKSFQNVVYWTSSILKKFNQK